MLHTGNSSLCADGANQTTSAKLINADVKHRWTGMMHDIIDRAEEAAVDLYNFEEDVKKKMDDRLFPNELLYCEGMPRPALRGMLHLYCALLLPFGFWHLVFNEGSSSPLAQFAAAVYLGGNLFCCVTSALYHVGKWSPSAEILLQKLDHCGIAVCSSGINFPAALLLLQWPWNFALAGLSTVTCAWTCWHVINRRPGVWRLIVNAAVIVLFMPLLFGYEMTNLEVACVCGNTLFQGIGVSIFVQRSPDPWPNVFGYHEVFHVFTLLGFASVYLCHWSIVHRTCNPYAYRLSVWDILMDALMGMGMGAGAGGSSLRGGILA